MCDQTIHDSILLAQVPARERIRRDRGRLPKRFRSLLEYIEEHLFDSRLSVVSALRHSGVRDTAISNQFKAHHGLALWQYVLQLRLETAARLLRDSDETIGRISDWVGFGSYSNFHRAYAAWAGETPSATRKRRTDSPVDLAVLRRAVNRQLSAEEARSLIELLFTLYPAAGQTASSVSAALGNSRPALLSQVDGASFEQFRAEREVWPALAGKSLGEQQEIVAGCTFVTSALFEFLLQKSREEGRKDRKKGIELAQLALFSLDVNADNLGHELHDLRALGWAWLANARRLAFDYIGSAVEIEQAYRVWEDARPLTDMQTLANIQSFDAILKRCQRHFDQSLALLDQAIPVLRLRNESTELVQALLVRSSTLGYQGNPRQGLVDLKEAASLFGDGESYLDLVICTNTAGLLVMSGDSREAEKIMPRAYELSSKVNDKIIHLQLLWVSGLIFRSQGRIREAKENLQISLEGFVELGAADHAEVVSSDLLSLDCDDSQAPVDRLSD